ncbi:MAG: ABC transporter ATP-binding protein [Pirellulales bacterium]|nr:ABC transporter ATP-binding protein [Pirellulales bacterium]
MIEVADFSKAYANHLAVDGLSFRVEAGQILGLLGPNGAGKTTTLRAIAGIIPPTRGRIAVAGHDVTQDATEAKRQLAYVPDDPALFDALTVWEHLRFIAAAYRVDHFEPQAEALLTQFELQEKRDVLAQELSRGMRQKVAICCAYLHRPQALLLDEPLTGLDPRGIRRLKESIVQLARDGAAVIMSSHLLSMVEDLCSHLLILHRGHRLFCGELSEARQAFAGSAHDSSLEEVFFRATEGTPEAPPAGAVASPAVDLSQPGGS